MVENSKIEWTNHTFNPWVGCTKISPACDHCYAEGWAKRSGMVQWGPHAERRRTSERHWKLPIKWNAQAQRLGVRYRVFCSSLADVFDNAVPQTWRWELFRTIAATPHLDWLLLTKRIGNAREMLNSAAAAVANDFCGTASWDREPWPNVWIGATICNQDEADRDIPKLLDVPAEKRFLSIEPMLGPISLIVPFDGAKVNAAIGARPGIPALDWVIAGGESGPKARPSHPDWFRSLRDQCKAAGVPFLFKQWGEWQIASLENGHTDRNMATNRAYWVHIDGAITKPSSFRTGIPTAISSKAYGMVKVGKARAGRLLDGRLWDEVPA